MIISQKKKKKNKTVNETKINSNNNIKDLYNLNFAWCKKMAGGIQI